MANDKRKSTVVIAGGSGFLGVSLATHLAASGKSVVVLSRHAPKVAGPWRHVGWDARTLGDWRRELDGVGGLMNLAGRSDPPDAVCTEDSCCGAGFAPLVGRAWEATFHASALESQRKVILRTSFVIGRDRGAGGGALARLKTLVRFGLGGRVGRGTQGMSWIHETDLNRLFERALFDETMHGMYVATAPNPVSQSVFMRELRIAMGIRTGLPAFAWMVRIGAPLLMRTDPELALYGRYLISQRLRHAGFEFQFAHLREALAELCSAQGTQSLFSGLTNRAARDVAAII